VSSLYVAAIAFACTLAAGLIGLAVTLGREHVADASRDAVRLVQALVASVAALVLGLLIASASDHYRSQSDALTAVAAKVVVLDRVLAEFGPEAAPARTALRKGVEDVLEEVWPGHRFRAFPATRAAIFDSIVRLEPRTPRDQYLHQRAMKLAMETIEARALLGSREASSAIQPPLLMVLIGWFVLLFAASGLFARPNATVISAMVAGALAVAAALFLVMELDRPFEGLMAVPDRHLRYALTNLGQP
jgi:hypothetical protein